MRREGSLGYFEIMLEKILHEVETVAEGHCGLVDRMDRLDAKLDRRANELDDKISCVAEELKETRKELKETRVDLSARIEAVGNKVEGHEDRIRFLERKAA